MVRRYVLCSVATALLPAPLTGSGVAARSRARFNFIHSFTVRNYTYPCVFLRICAYLSVFCRPAENTIFVCILCNLVYMYSVDVGLNTSNT